MFTAAQNPRQNQSVQLFMSLQDSQPTISLNLKGGLVSILIKDGFCHFDISLVGKAIAV